MEPGWIDGGSSSGLRRSIRPVAGLYQRDNLSRPCFLCEEDATLLGVSVQHRMKIRPGQRALLGVSGGGLHTKAITFQPEVSPGEW